MKKIIPVPLNSWQSFWLKLFIPLLTVAACFPIFFGARYALGIVSYMIKQQDSQQTIVLGNTFFAPSSDAALRVVVQDTDTGRPVKGAKVKVSLKTDTSTITLFQGRTGSSGTAPVKFRIPEITDSDNKSSVLVVEARSGSGHDTLEQPITIRQNFRMLLSTDKPLYQPGQTIHLRTLVLRTHDLTAAHHIPVSFLTEDSKGNKVWRQTVMTSAFGVASADFTLANRVNQGNYKLSAYVGQNKPGYGRAERTIEVRTYMLPKFGIKISTDRSFYLPGHRVKGTIRANYFYGKPVVGGKVQITGADYDVKRTVVAGLQGETNENGAYQFDFKLPDCFADSGPDIRQARFRLEVTVTDKTEHSEQTDLILPVAVRPVIIEAVPESGVLKPGIENIIYILTAYPDGQPAPCNLEIRINESFSYKISSNSDGLARFRFTPGESAFKITARDKTGLTGSRTIQFKKETGPDNVLLRTDRATYFAGETMRVTALSPADSGDIYLDIVKHGQTISARSAAVRQGSAEFSVDAGPDMYGTLELHAYKVLPDRTIVRDTRIVVVDAPRDVAVNISSNKEIYLPGETAILDIRTTNASGKGLQTALGVSVADESVYALERHDPGFAKLCFLQKAELPEPRCQTRGFEFPLKKSVSQTEKRKTWDDSVKAAWADAVPDDFSLNITSNPQKKLQSQQLLNDSHFVKFCLSCTAFFALLFCAYMITYSSPSEFIVVIIIIGILSAISVPNFITYRTRGYNHEKEEPILVKAEKSKVPRLRQFFPETLYWNPEVITDKNGLAQLSIPVADSITTWRLTATASSQDGQIGFTTRGIRVFQDFFADADLPAFLTQGDEISIPVGVFNYLPQTQAVHLVVEQSPWFELTGPAEQTLTVAGNDTEVAYFPIRVLKFGEHGFQVTAQGSKMSDAIRRQTSVVPDGREIRHTKGNRLHEPVEVALDIPPTAVPDASFLKVRIYPGVLSQMVEGLEKIIRMPFG